MNLVPTDPSPQATVMVVSHEASRTGAPRVAIELLRALRECGYRTVVVHRWGGDLEAAMSGAADLAVDEPLRWLRVALRRTRFTKQLSYRLERWAARRLLRRFSPELVWCNTVVSHRYAVLASELGIPAILYAHEQDEWFPSGALSMADSVRRSPIALVACSRSAADVLGAAVGGPASVEVLTSPVDVDAVASAAAIAIDLPAPSVVGCGTADSRKGFDVFLDAARRSLDVEDGVTWYWVGHSGQVPEGVPSNTKLIDSVPDAAPYLGAASVFVCPSRSDSFPLVVLEAMALNRPIVATSLPGIREQLGDTGLLVSPGDVTELYGAVRRLIDDPAAAQELGRSAGLRCRETWDVSSFRARVCELTSRAIGVAT